MTGGPFVALPVRLIDDVMPTLTDTEWRVLCVVARATLGWRAAGGSPKQRDWLSQSQLKARTGRASAAVSLAVDRLVSKDLIVVTTEASRVLRSARDRRRHHGRLYYGLSPRLGSQPQSARHSPTEAVFAFRSSQGKDDNRQTEQQ